MILICVLLCDSFVRDGEIYKCNTPVGSQGNAFILKILLCSFLNFVILEVSVLMFLVVNTCAPLVF